MGPNERRMEIIEALCRRRQDNMANLATEFGVSVRTIKNDIDILSLSYPIETIRGRYGEAKLAALMQEGKQAEVKALLQKHGGEKLSDVLEENYPALLKDAEGV